MAYLRNIKSLSTSTSAAAGSHRDLFYKCLDRLSGRAQKAISAAERDVVQQLFPTVNTISVDHTTSVRTHPPRSVSVATHSHEEQLVFVLHMLARTHAHRDETCEFVAAL